MYVCSPTAKPQPHISPRSRGARYQAMSAGKNCLLQKCVISLNKCSFFRYKTMHSTSVMWGCASQTRVRWQEPASEMHDLCYRDVWFPDRKTTHFTSLKGGALTSHISAGKSDLLQKCLIFLYERIIFQYTTVHHLQQFAIYYHTTQHTTINYITPHYNASQIPAIHHNGTPISALHCVSSHFIALHYINLP